MESPFERRFVLRKKSKEPPKEKPTDKAVEPERLLSLQGVDLSGSKLEEKNETTESGKIREYIPERLPSDTVAVEGNKIFGQKELSSSKKTGQGASNLGGTVRYKKHKTNLTRLYR